jgi:hypothetical protein
MKDLKRFAVFDNLGSNSFLNKRNIKTLKEKINEENVDENNGYLLKVACKYNLFDLVRHLVSYDADASLDNYKCIQICCDYSNFNLLLYLLKKMSSSRMLHFIDYMLTSNWSIYQMRCILHSFQVIKPNLPRTDSTTIIPIIPIIQAEEVDNLNSDFSLECKICLRKYDKTTTIHFIFYSKKHTHTHTHTSF